MMKEMIVRREIRNKVQLSDELRNWGRECDVVGWGGVGDGRGWVGGREGWGVEGDSHEYALSLGFLFLLLALFAHLLLVFADLPD